MQEGMKVPVLLAGHGFTSDLRVKIVANGGGHADDILPGAFYALGLRGGVTLHIQTIRDLGAAPDGRSEERTYTLRLERPGNGCQFAETTFVVEGLNEFDPGDPRPGRYSQIDIPANVTIHVPLDGLELEATGTVTISGTVSARGRDGEGGAGQDCGGLPSGEDHDVCGRDLEPTDGRGGLGREDDDLHRRNIGAPGSLFNDLDVGPGAGGQAGGNLDFAQILNDIGTAIISGIGCFEGDVISCYRMGEAIVSAGNGIAEATEGPNGHAGFGGIANNSGGGGGGAGLLSIGPLPPLPPIFVPCTPLFNLSQDSGGSVKLLGGGGGQGGSPGRRFSLITPGSIVLDGTVTSMGGRGGDGSNLARFAIDSMIGELCTIPLDIPTFRRWRRRWGRRWAAHACVGDRSGAVQLAGHASDVRWRRRRRRQHTLREREDRNAEPRRSVAQSRHFRHLRSVDARHDGDEPIALPSSSGVRGDGRHHDPHRGRERSDAKCPGDTRCR